MKQVVNIIFNEKKINDIRRKYDPEVNRTKNHLTLVYPFEDGNQKELVRKIKEALIGTRPFKIIFSNYSGSEKGFYLRLLPAEGKKNVISIQKKLSLFLPFNNKNMPKFIPHISLGVLRKKDETR